MAAMEQAYKGSIMVGKFPSCVLHLDMPAETVDANVHPAKIEVRFINEKPVFDAVYHAVRTALESGDTRRQVSLPPRVVTPPKPEAEQLQFVRPQTAHAAAARTAERSFPETADQARRRKNTACAGFLGSAAGFAGVFRPCDAQLAGRYGLSCDGFPAVRRAHRY